MRGVVDAEPDGQDDVDAGERVDGDVPEVEEPDDVDQSEKNANLNKQQNWIIKIFFYEEHEYYNHLWDLKIVAVVERWSLF